MAISIITIRDKNRKTENIISIIGEIKISDRLVTYDCIDNKYIEIHRYIIEVAQQCLKEVDS